MGACSSTPSVEAPSPELHGPPGAAAPSNYKQPNLVSLNTPAAAPALHTANTWAAAPGSFCINDEGDGRGETWDDLFPINGGHRRTRSGYSAQLSHDPVHQRKLKALRELKARNMNRAGAKKPSLALGDSVSPIKEASDAKLETAYSSESPPSMSLSPADCPSSLRLKRTRPIKLKGQRRMTAGQELLAPKKSKLKSAMFDRPRVQVNAAVASGSDEEESEEDDEEGVTPVVNNKSARKQKAPSVSITSSVRAVQHSPKSGALSPRGKSSTFDSIVVPPDHDTASPRVQQRPNNVVDTTPTGLISPKGARKSPKGQKKAFDFSDDVADENKAPLMSPKGARKSPKGKSTFTFDTDENTAPTSDLDASFSSVGMLSPRGEVRRRKSREKKKKKGKGKEEEGGEEEVWHAVPKYTAGKKAKSLKEGGLGHCHPNAAKK